VRTNLVAGASRVLLCCAFLLPQASAFQMPAPLGRLHITSTPAGATISINNVKRKDITPVLLAVVPNTYTIVIGTCPNQPITVTVASGETKEVACK
jgi:hypothetical protein